MPTSYVHAAGEELRVQYPDAMAREDAHAIVHGLLSAARVPPPASVRRGALSIGLYRRFWTTLYDGPAGTYQVVVLNDTVYIGTALG